MLTVIIPAYNCATTLRRAIKSAESYTFGKGEIIVVNDGSIDATKHICDNLEKEIKSLKVFHTRNQGVSSARNLGIANSSKEYITFLDSDDYFIGRMPQKLGNMLEVRHVDIIVAGYDEKNRFFSNKKYLSNQTFWPKMTQKENFLFYADNGTFSGICSCNVWAKFYKREFLVQNHIKFDLNLFINEDGLFNLNCISLNPTISIIPYSGYCYNRYRSSISPRRVDNGNFSLCTKKIITLMRQNGISDLDIKLFEKRRKLSNICFAVLTYAALSPISKYKEFKNKVSTLNYDVKTSDLEAIDIKNLSIHKLLFYYSIRYKTNSILYLLGKIYYFLGKK